MPGLPELQAVEFKDFTGGLYERTDREAPPNALLALTNAYPMPSGGIRSFAEFTPMTHTGLTAGSIIIGLQKVVGFPGPQGVLYCMTLEIDAGGSGIHTLRLHKMQDDTTTALIEGSTWTTIFTQTGIAAIDPSINIETYHTLVNGFGHYFPLLVQDTAGLSSGISGVYRTSTTALLTATNIVGVGRVIPGTFFPNVLAVHQDRLLFNVTAPLSLNLSRVVYTEPRSDTSPSTANQFEPIGTDAGFVGWMAPNQPSDLVVGKDERGIVLIQGDLTAPLVREMTYSFFGMSMFPANTEKGVVYLSQDNSVFLWNTGGLQDIAPGFYRTPMQPDVYPASFSVVFSNSVKLGQMAYGGGFVFAGKDYVLDMATGAWFRVETLNQNGAGKHFTTDPHNYRVYAATNAVYTGNNKVLYYTPSFQPGSDSWTPSSSWSATLPLQYTHGQSTNLRELNFYLVTFEANSTLDVSIEYSHPLGAEPLVKEYPTITLDAATSQNVRIPVSIGAEWFKVSFTLTAPSLEAPMLEKVVLGVQKSTRTKGA